MVTRITVHVGFEKTEEWMIPDGFEQAYTWRASHPIGVSLWCDIMAEAGFDATMAMFERLTPQQRIEAEIYISDKRHPHPVWLK